jgi:hypothetical protein
MTAITLLRPIAHLSSFKSFHYKMHYNLDKSYNGPFIPLHLANSSCSCVDERCGWAPKEGRIRRDNQLESSFSRSDL